ncbi:MAG: hypothetical protein RL033_3988, partial [Pseudomonadota bacterium]
VAVLDGQGARQLLAPDATLRLLQSALEPAEGVQSSVSDVELDEALEEAAFLDEREVASVEQRAFARAIAQLERHVEDRALLQRRDRTTLLDTLQKTREQLAAAPGADARTRAETLLERTQLALDVVDAELARLGARRDEAYERGRALLHQKRYSPPLRETILEAEFVVG